MPEATSYFTAEQRRALLDEFFELYDRYMDDDTIWSRQRGQVPTISDAELTALKDRLRKGDERIREIIQCYNNQVPIVPLSRCPFCQAINYHSFDFYDLDGLWWWSEEGWGRTVDNGCRPRKRHRPCPHFWALSGAVTIRGTVSPSPIRVQPGPEIPFVFTHTLNAPSIKVVISQFSVGAHTAYPIAYFSDVKPVPREAVRPYFKEWAKNCALIAQSKTGVVDYGGTDNLYYPLADARSSYLSRAADDFDLAPWIEQGRVLWIAPGDESLTLQQQVEGCPYLNLPGRRKRLSIWRGKVRTLPPG
ncbi:MAG: hypothetical protein AAFX78_08615 [Cyanobacteria bacterium J06638_20]